ncbi:hypothetical protein [Streptomyces sp. NPDC005017]|uniref:hypothetical protein n=1 Tax=Streptomyces sp. NPDC005017 TaxID=3364706 RepID=UPI0036C88A54
MAVMNVGGTLLGKQVTKRYPRRGDLQLVRLGTAASFTCSRCAQTKTARLVAVRGNALFCNGCYGRTEAERSLSEESGGSSAVSTPSSAVRHAEPSPSDVRDPSRVVVGERDWGLPFAVVHTDQMLGWKFSVRAEHLLLGTFPIPVEMADKVPPTSLNVALVPIDELALVQAAKRVPVLDYQPGVKLHLDGDRPLLTGMAWHRFVLPGTRVSVRWDHRAKTRLHIAYTRLRRPVVVAGTIVRYAYDPRIMTRDLAAADVRADRSEELVLITLRELGYLDEQGRALLPLPALLRNITERAEPGETSAREFENAVRRLLARKVLTWEWGSVGAGGTLRYPARDGESTVELLCYTPALREVEHDDPGTASGGRTEAGAHRVAGHLMRIGHLGKEASAEARAAYRYDHQRAGLAGPHELPRGFTYVREHERGV